MSDGDFSEPVSRILYKEAGPNLLLRSIGPLSHKMNLRPPLVSVIYTKPSVIPDWVPY